MAIFSHSVGMSSGRAASRSLTPWRVHPRQRRSRARPSARGGRLEDRVLSDAPPVPSLVRAAKSATHGRDRPLRQGDPMTIADAAPTMTDRASSAHGGGGLTRHSSTRPVAALALAAMLALPAASSAQDDPFAQAVGYLGGEEALTGLSGIAIDATGTREAIDEGPNVGQAARRGDDLRVPDRDRHRGRPHAPRQRHLGARVRDHRPSGQ